MLDYKKLLYAFGMWFIISMFLFLSFCIFYSIVGWIEFSWFNWVPEWLMLLILSYFIFDEVKK